MSATYLIGDIHGHLDTLLGLLRGADLIGPDRTWTGDDSTLWLMGDLCDRGPDGIAVIDLVMRLQTEAEAAGGMADSLLGNHDVLLLAADRFGRNQNDRQGHLFYSGWKRNGGDDRDLQWLCSEHVHWLSTRPAMALQDDVLLLHADSPLYLRYGSSISAVNRALADLLHGSDALRWHELLSAFSEHKSFLAASGGEERAAEVLRQFGGSRLVHGHSPISNITRQDPATVLEPLVYAHGRCTDIDGGIYLGGPGFVKLLKRGTP
jgi:hypothetical protein